MKQLKERHGAIATLLLSAGLSLFSAFFVFGLSSSAQAQAQMRSVAAPYGGSTLTTVTGEATQGHDRFVNSMDKSQVAMWHQIEHETQEGAKLRRKEEKETRRAPSKAESASGEQRLRPLSNAHSLWAKQAAQATARTQQSSTDVPWYLRGSASPSAQARKSSSVRTHDEYRLKALHETQSARPHAGRHARR